ncbi:MAG: 6-phosphogluconolactonase [Deltaproteobacteria bacterium]|jgi:6-phosphogluconolactonase|nr:6-phosphogluconolactonase [Deltaproteobacteria bacterium]
MEPNTLQRFKTPQDAVNELVDRIIRINKTTSLQNQSCHIALSGGSTPKLLFQTLSKTERDKIDWNMIHIYWVDDRCVPPDHPESNFGMTKLNLLDHVPIPGENIHRMIGEADPKMEAVRYSKELLSQIPLNENIPRFDLIILGIGDDGHTASIFPNQMTLLEHDSICAVGVHPVSGQKRITLTGNTICNGKTVIFLVTGSEKSSVVAEIFNQTELATIYPAAHIKPLLNPAEWFVDAAAAIKIH